MNYIACLPNYWLLLLLVAGLRFRKLFGPDRSSKIWKVKCSAVDPLWETIGPCEVGHVTCFIVIVRHRTMCASCNLIHMWMPHFVNDRIRQLVCLVLPLALTCLHCVRLEKKYMKLFILPCQHALHSLPCFLKFSCTCIRAFLDRLNPGLIYVDCILCGRNTSRSPTQW